MFFYQYGGSSEFCNAVSGENLEDLYQIAKGNLRNKADSCELKIKLGRLISKARKYIDTSEIKETYKTICLN
tara:strand:- start:66471 stop:66686 length:216 start_codon:yes stop_codon:yes gene_type:complete